MLTYFLLSLKDRLIPVKDNKNDTLMNENCDRVIKNNPMPKINESDMDWMCYIDKEIVDHESML